MIAKKIQKRVKFSVRNIDFPAPLDWAINYIQKKLKVKICFRFPTEALRIALLRNDPWTIVSI